MKVFVTGGAGCIGSELCVKLIEQGDEVVVYDNMSSGKTEHLEDIIGAECTLVEGDVLEKEALLAAMKGCNIVYHLAANPDIKYKLGDPLDKDFTQNAVGTYNVLEAMSIEGIKKMVFSSSSAVLGVPEKIPTAEDYGPLVPISLYGASKLSCEAFISAFCHMLEFQAWVFRFGNIVGNKNRKKGTTVITDFIRKLRENPNELEILGDGNQRKSFLHVDDCVDGMITLMKKSRNNYNLINLSAVDSITIKQLGEIVADEMGLKNVKFRFTGGPQGWRGDVNKMWLDTTKSSSLGWKPKYNSEQAVRKSIRAILDKKV